MLDLLATKFHAPRLRAQVVSRPRLVDRLAQGAARRLTLVSAPAGFGKTTAVGEWIASAGMPVAWLSLDEGDNDPSRFWGHFVGCLRTVDAELGKSPSLLLSSPLQVSAQSFLTALLNEAAAFDRPFAVVIEDYHVINNQAIHDDLAFLLEHLPPHAHLTIVTRTDPPLPLGRLRARDDLVELRAGDLRFTAAEAADYFNLAMGLHLGSREVSALASRSEGWIAGLQMAALSMQDCEDVEEFVQSLTGSHRFILDYLAEEVLRHQPQELQDFLKETSILHRLSGPLCDAVTGGVDGRKKLAMLEAANLFLVPLDDDRKWYRYHHLFAEFLRTFLEESEADRICELHRRAADWLAKNGFESEAIHHALRTGDSSLPAQLMEAFGGTVLWRDSGQWTVLNWVNSLPTEAIDSRPRLGILKAWAKFTTGEWETLVPLLDRLDRAVGTEYEEAERRVSHGEIATIRSGVSYENGEMERSIELALHALELLPDDAAMVRAVAAFQLGLGRLFTGDLPEADAAFVEATNMGGAAGNTSISLLAIGCRAQIGVIEGRLSAAARLYERAKEGGGAGANWLLPPAGLACVQMGEVLRERNELEDAERVLREGIGLCQQQGAMPEHVLNGYATLARVLDALGRPEDAHAAAEQADQLMAEFLSRSGDVAVVVSQALHHQLRRSLAHGNMTALDRWMASQSQGSTSPVDAAHLADRILLARCLVVRGSAGEALRHLEGLAEVAERVGRIGVAVESLVLTALLVAKRDRQAEALSLVKRAVSLAEPEGHIRVFTEEGEAMRRLLTQVDSRHAMRCLNAFPPIARTNATPHDLSERELALLRLMAAGRSNDEIARELFLSLNTVKWHARNLYGKLGVHSRSSAVACARELLIL